MSSSENLGGQRGMQHPATSLLPGRRSPRHGKWTVMMLGASIVLNAVLVLYCANLQFMRPLEYDREKELGMLEKQDTQLKAQAVRLEATTRNLEEQKRQLQQHYKETEDVGRKLDEYKGKLSADAVEVKNAESAAEILMQRLAKAQGTTMSAKTELKREKARLDKVRAELAKTKEQEVDIQKNEQTDALVRALQRSDSGGQMTSTERANLCHACTCTKYC
mmetsp:Transcript_22648/g.56671  ORF Transcript_22648/g.56671 Transcript_22648/m.56671 type:complete len:220 (+) Transcript_22648:130-789(+)